MIWLFWPPPKPKPSSSPSPLSLSLSLSLSIRLLCKCFCFVQKQRLLLETLDISLQLHTFSLSPSLHWLCISEASIQSHPLLLLPIDLCHSLSLLGCCYFQTIQWLTESSIYQTISFLLLNPPISPGLPKVFISMVSFDLLSFLVNYWFWLLIWLDFMDL